MSSSTFPGFGGFPGSTPWPAPVGSNAPGSDDAELLRLAGAPNGGGPFFSGSTLYFGNFQQVANSLGGTLALRDVTPVPSIRTIVFQIKIAEAVGHDFFEPAGMPVLKLNGGNGSIAPTHTKLIDSVLNGTFDSPETGEEPLYLNTWGFQWNLGAAAVSSFSIEFSAVTHAQIHEMRLNQGSQVVASSLLSDPTPTVQPRFSISSIGQPSHNGVNTTVVHGFQGDANATYSIEYKEALESASWTSAGTYSTGNGTFSVSFSGAGDRRAAWSQKMFFRATRQ